MGRQLFEWLLPVLKVAPHGSLLVHSGGNTVRSVRSLQDVADEGLAEPELEPNLFRSGEALGASDEKWIRYETSISYSSLINCVQYIPCCSPCRDEFYQVTMCSTRLAFVFLSPPQNPRSSFLKSRAANSQQFKRVRPTRQ